MFPIPRKTKVNLWRAALYGALFMLAVRSLHTAVSSDSFYPGDMRTFGGNLAEFIGYFLCGSALFVGVGYINNRRLARQDST
jgi:O-antigen ligase